MRAWCDESAKQIKALIEAGYEFSEKDIFALQADQRKSVISLAGRIMRKNKEKARLLAMYNYENEAEKVGFRYIAGIDEAGRGPLAGPVVAGAVILPSNCLIEGLNDSKKIAPGKRELLEKQIKEKAIAWGIGAVGARDIDQINIYQAAKLAMARAVKNLEQKPDYLLLDAMVIKDLVALPQEGIIKGDSKSASIAAASILAKNHRDRIMAVYAQKYPAWNFERHKGYPTPEHIALVNQKGYSPIHRLTFKVKKNT